MESWRELSSSLSSYVRGRVTNPIFGAYLVAWGVLNFRLVLVLIGDGSWADKIGYIDTRLYTEWWHWLIFGFIYPLSVSLVLVFAMPFINRWTTVFLRARDAETTRLLLAQQNEAPMPKAEAATLRRQLLTERQSRLDERAESEQRLMEQAAQIDLLLQENKKLKSASGGSVLGEPQISSSETEPLSAYQLKDADFVGVPSRVKSQLVHRGLTHTQALALYAVRNGQKFNERTLGQIMGLSELHVAMVLLDQLKGLGLTDHMFIGDREIHQISSAGRQALDAALKRGFTPPPLQEPNEVE